MFNIQPKAIGMELNQKQLVHSILLYKKQPDQLSARRKETGIDSLIICGDIVRFFRVAKRCPGHDHETCNIHELPHLFGRVIKSTYQYEQTPRDRRA